MRNRQERRGKSAWRPDGGPSVQNEEFDPAAWYNR